MPCTCMRFDRKSHVPKSTMGSTAVACSTAEERRRLVVETEEKSFSTSRKLRSSEAAAEGRSTAGDGSGAGRRQGEGERDGERGG